MIPLEPEQDFHQRRLVAQRISELHRAGVDPFDPIRTVAFGGDQPRSKQQLQPQLDAITIGVVWQTRRTVSALVTWWIASTCAEREAACRAAFSQ